MYIFVFLAYIYSLGWSLETCGWKENGPAQTGKNVTGSFPEHFPESSPEHFFCWSTHVGLNGKKMLADIFQKIARSVFQRILKKAAQNVVWKVLEKPFQTV